MVEIRNRNSIAQLLDDGIFYIHYLPETYSTVDDFIESNNSYKTLSKGKSLKILVEMGVLSSLDLEAREYNENTEKCVIAEAVVLHSLPQRLLFSFYIKFRINNHPLKIFKDKSLALDWLRKV